MKHKPTASEISTALLWLKDEIAFQDIIKKFGSGKKSGNVLYRVAVCLREAYRKGTLITVEVKK